MAKIGRAFRLWHSFRLALAKGEKKKKYVEKFNLFALYGDGVVFQPKTLPLYSQLIKIHDNVVIGRNVEFVTHDVLHRCFNAARISDETYREHVGCIEVMDNSFVGNGSILMYGIKVAENNIIAAGSVVTKSTEPNSVYAGIPARRIGAYDQTALKRMLAQKNGNIATVENNQALSAEEASLAWALFYRTIGDEVVL